MSDTIDDLGLPPSRDDATPEQVEIANERARELHKRRDFVTRGLNAAMQPGMTLDDAAALRPDLASEIVPIDTELADIREWLGTSGIYR